MKITQTDSLRTPQRKQSWSCLAGKLEGKSFIGQEEFGFRHVYFVEVWGNRSGNVK